MLMVLKFFTVAYKRIGEEESAETFVQRNGSVRDREEVSNTSTAKNPWLLCHHCIQEERREEEESRETFVQRIGLVRDRDDDFNTSTVEIHGCFVIRTPITFAPVLFFRL
ncbi:hypothetical protein Droror1_Dr00006575 [Drosera rotundifolia]